QPERGIGEAKTLGPEPGAQHAVLGAQVLDRFALPATDPAGDQQNEKVERSGGCHGRRTIARPFLERDVAPDRPQPRAIDFWDTTRPMRPVLAFWIVLCFAGLGCLRAGAMDGTACQVNAGTRCYDLTSMKQPPGGSPVAADDSRTLADERPANPPSDPVMNQMRPGLYETRS